MRENVGSKKLHNNATFSKPVNTTVKTTLSVMTAPNIVGLLSEVPVWSKYLIIKNGKATASPIKWTK